MKALLLSFILLSCHSNPFAKSEPVQNRYYIVVERKSYSPITGEYEPDNDVDSIFAVSDSEAFHKGYISFVANLKTADMLKKQGIKHPIYYATGFDVLNKDGLTIRYNISDEQMKQEEEFKKRNLVD